MDQRDIKAHREKAGQYELRAGLARATSTKLRPGSYAYEVSERLARNYDRMAATERHKARELEEGDG